MRRLLIGVLVLMATRADAQVDRAQTRAPLALRDLLAEASQRNVLPPSLISFTAHVETEISVLLRREEGNEAVAAVEQVASTLKWNRTGFYDQHIVGYRAQQTGANVSMLSVFQTGWLNPVLYGNRLRVRASSPAGGQPGAPVPPRAPAPPTQCRPSTRSPSTGTGTIAFLVATRSSPCALVIA